MTSQEGSETMVDWQFEKHNPALVLHQITNYIYSFTQPNDDVSFTMLFLNGKKSDLVLLQNLMAVNGLPMKFMTLLPPPLTLSSRQHHSMFTAGWIGEGRAAVLVCGDLYTPHWGSDKHLLTEKNANRPVLLRHRTTVQGGVRGSAEKKGKGEREEDPPPTFTSCKLSSRGNDPEFSRTMQLLWWRRSRDMETLWAPDVRVRLKFNRNSAFVWFVALITLLKWANKIWINH